MLCLRPRAIRVLVLGTSLAILVGCPVGGTGTPCSTSENCSSGQVCINSRCEKASDAGGDATGTDAPPSDAGDARDTDQNDVGDAAEGGDAADAADAEGDDAPDSSDASDAAEASDSQDASDTTDATDATDATDSADTFVDAPPCSIPSACDDGVACTIDLCIDASCVFAPDLGGAVLLFDGECPTGFTEATEARDLFVRGHDGDATFGETGGTATHTHAVPGHAHTTSTDGAHTHSVTIESAALQPYTGMTVAVASGGHTHSVASVDSAGSHTHTVGTQGEESGPASNVVAYREAVFCRAASGTSLVPEDAIAPFRGDCPDGWDEDVTFRDRMLRGHDGDTTYGETGGSDTHAHSVSSHTHDLEDTDGHAAAHSLVLLAPSGTVAVTSPGGAQVSFAPSTHTHSGSTLAAGSALHAHTSGAVDANLAGTEDDLPAWSEFTFCRKDATTSNQTAQGLFSALWLGEDCPSCWAEVTVSRNRMLRGSDGAAPATETGGDDQHSHPADHGHGASDVTGPHNHTVDWVTDGSGIASTLIGGTGGANAALHGHTHGAVVDNDGHHSHVLMSGAMSTAEVSGVPPYIEGVACAPSVPGS